MTIETKYSPDSQVYVIDENKVYIRKILVVKVTTRYNENKSKALSRSDIGLQALSMPDYISIVEYIMYPFGDKKLKETFKEEECFPSKDSLLKSL